MRYGGIRITFWGYLVLLFIVGMIIEESLGIWHEHKMEQIKLIQKLNRKEEP